MSAAEPTLSLLAYMRAYDEDVPEDPLWAALAGAQDSACWPARREAWRRWTEGGCPSGRDRPPLRDLVLAALPSGEWSGSRSVWRTLGAVFDHPPRWGHIVKELGRLVAEGAVKRRGRTSGAAWQKIVEVAP